MGWQYNNDMNNLFMNFMINQAAGPYGWTSSWGDGVQFNMNSIMTMTPWQAYNFQAINGMVNFGIPMNPFMMAPTGAPSADSYVNMAMNQRRYAKAETALKTLDSTKENLNKMLTQEGVTEAQKATIKEQIKKIEELQAKIEALKPEMQTDKDWQQVYDEFEALMGEKTEIDTKIKELIEEVAKANEADDDDAVDADDDDAVDADDDSDSDTDVDTDPEATAALTANAKTKTDAERNLSIAYGENAEPTGVTVTDDGKFSIQVTDKNGEQKTKTYSSVEEMQNAAITRVPKTKADAERDLEIVFGNEKAESGVTVKEIKNGETVTGIKYVYKNKEYATIHDVLEIKKSEAEAEQAAKAQEQQAKAAQEQHAAEQAELAKYDASDAKVAEIANTFHEAVDGWITGTDDEKFEKSVSRLNSLNIIEVMDAYAAIVKAEGEDVNTAFIDAFNWDADAGQRYEVGNYIYKALFERYYGANINDTFENFPKPDKDGKYEKLDYDNFKLKENTEVEKAFNTLMKESNASVWTDNDDVKEAVATIVKAIKAKEAQAS